MDLHSETDLSEGCVPVGRQFGLLCVEHCLPSWNIIRFHIAPKFWIIAKCFLQDNILRKLTLQPWTNFKHVLLTLLTTKWFNTPIKLRVTGRSIAYSTQDTQILKTVGVFIDTISFLRKSLVRDTKATSPIDHLMIARSQAHRTLTLKKHLTW